MGKFSRLGNDLYTGRKSIDFVGKTRIWYAISGLIIVAAVLGLYFKGLNFGVVVPTLPKNAKCGAASFDAFWKGRANPAPLPYIRNGYILEAWRKRTRRRRR